MYRVDSVGTVPAALATYALLQAFAPDLLINAGTAGGFKVLGAARSPKLLALRVPLSTDTGAPGAWLTFTPHVQAQGGSVGDVFLGSAARHHDRHIQMPVYDKYGVYELPCLLTPKLREARAGCCQSAVPAANCWWRKAAILRRELRCARLGRPLRHVLRGPGAQALGLKLGVVSSGNSLAASEQDLQHLKVGTCCLPWLTNH